MWWHTLKSMTQKSICAGEYSGVTLNSFKAQSSKQRVFIGVWGTLTAAFIVWWNCNKCFNSFPKPQYSRVLQRRLHLNKSISNAKCSTQRLQNNLLGCFLDMLIKLTVQNQTWSIMSDCVAHSAGYSMDSWQETLNSAVERLDLDVPMASGSQKDSGESARMERDAQIVGW